MAEALTQSNRPWRIMLFGNMRRLGVLSRDQPHDLKIAIGEVQCKERLGGLLKHYHRAAA